MLQYCTIRKVHQMPVLITILIAMSELNLHLLLQLNNLTITLTKRI